MSKLLSAASQYVLHDQLGAGGMGMVHLGTMVTPAGERRVAVKQLLERTEATAKATERLAAEARLVFQLTHAKICQVLDLGCNDDGVFMVMEYVAGLDLRTLLSRLGGSRARLAVPIAIHVAREIAQALDYAHRRTDATNRSLLLVHGDVTPRNILLSEEGEVKLADFGIARALHTLAPGNQLRGGTPGFAAPEALGGDVDHRADIYSLGVTLYAALGGAEPHRHKVDVAALCRARPELTRDVASILERATAVRREERFLSAADLERALAFELARRYPSFTPSDLGKLVRTHGDPGPGPQKVELGPIHSVAHPDIVTTFAQAAIAPPASEVTTLARASTTTLPSAINHGTRRIAPARARSRWAWAAILPIAGAAAVWHLWQSGPTASPPSPPPVVTTASPVATTSSPSPPVTTTSSVTASPIATTSPPSPMRRSEPVEPSSTARGARRPVDRPEKPGTGYLTISSVPWGAVYVDGVRVAEQTPVYRLRVSAGRHRVSIVNPKRRASSPVQVIVVEAGDVRDLGFNW